MKDIEELLSGVATSRRVQKNTILLFQGDVPHLVEVLGGTLSIRGCPPIRENGVALYRAAFPSGHRGEVVAQEGTAHSSK